MSNANESNGQGSVKTTISILGKASFTNQGKVVNLKSVQVVLLIAYVTELQTAVARKDLAELFWPERDAKDALKLLRTLLSRVTTLLPNYLESYTSATGVKQIRLADLGEKLSTTYVDSLVFKKLLQHDDVSALESASKLYKGSFLTGVEAKGVSQELEAWLERTRESYQQHYIALQQKLIALAYESRDFEKTLFNLQKLLILEPFDYTLNRLALTLYYKLENKLALVNHYNYLVQRTEEEFATTVLQELSDYYQQLLKKLELNSTQAISGNKKLDYSLNGLSYNETFIGRQKELNTLKLLISQERLVSIVGMQGIGKSSLLAELLKYCEAEMCFKDGIVFIPQHTTSKLEPTLDLVDSLAQQLGVVARDSSELLLQDVLEYLETRELLIAFDSPIVSLDAQQALIDLIATLIAQTTKLKIILTSLEPIGFANEVVMNLKGLDFPTKMISLEDAFVTSSAQLFLSCAKKVVPEFKLQETSLKALYKLCYLSQGSPLIITIAASWIDVLSLEEISSSLLELTHQHKDVIRRHQSVKAIFETLWLSQNKIPSTEQAHYASKTDNNAGIIITLEDLQSFRYTTAIHPLYQQFCTLKQ